ncbi:DUF2892 domain-containing protein [Candidatus Uhrbacteria bacterium]|nr:DUF2892 domain-containing protein [Candidatus Uhrbacteria bacterium]
MLKRNLDVTDRVLRFALAFWWLGPWAPTFTADWANVVVLVIAWISLVESFLGWCWIHRALGLDKK